jgi:hypothetical protein
MNAAYLFLAHPRARTRVVAPRIRDESWQPIDTVRRVAWLDITLPRKFVVDSNHA